MWVVIGVGLSWIGGTAAWAVSFGFADSGDDGNLGDSLPLPPSFN